MVAIGSASGAGASGRGGRTTAGAPSNERKGLGCDAQSRYPSDRANAWKWCFVPS